MHPLDNVIWTALTTCQAEYAEGDHLARRFLPEVTSLAALREPTREAFDSLSRLLPEGGTAGLVVEEPTTPPGWTLVADVPLLQMIHEDGPLPASGQEMVQLTEADVPEMVALATLTKPGPFGRRTHELGTFLGVRPNGQLAAMAGERLRIHGYTEVSAVCTHPDHAGHGYATALVREVVERIRQRGEIPFLHVRADNQRAIDVYYRLGFQDRALLHMTVLRKSA